MIRSGQLAFESLCSALSTTQNLTFPNWPPIGEPIFQKSLEAVTNTDNLIHTMTVVAILEVLFKGAH